MPHMRRGSGQQVSELTPKERKRAHQAQQSFSDYGAILQSKCASMKPGITKRPTLGKEI